MAKRKIQKIKCATLIVVGEGPHDKAFLNHMKGIYDTRETGQKVTIDSADGGSPRNIIDSVTRKHRHADFDRRYILLDSDVAISQQDRDRARKNNIVLIESIPHCLEGMLLEILGLRIPSNSQACKDALHPRLSGEPTDKRAYAELFPKRVLDQTQKEQIIILRHVISNDKN